MLGRLLRRRKCIHLSLLFLAFARLERHTARNVDFTDKPQRSERSRVLRLGHLALIFGRNSIVWRIPAPGISKPPEHPSCKRINAWKLKIFRKKPRIRQHISDFFAQQLPCDVPRSNTFLLQNLLHTLLQQLGKSVN